MEKEATEGRVPLLLGHWQPWEWPMYCGVLELSKPFGKMAALNCQLWPALPLGQPQWKISEKEFSLWVGNSHHIPILSLLGALPASEHQGGAGGRGGLGLGLCVPAMKPHE